MTSRPRIPTELAEVDCQNLTGLVKREATDYAEFSGGFADVYIGHYAKDANTQVKVAIKVLRLARDDPGTPTIKTHLVRETVVWTRLDHPNILGFLGLAEDLGRNDCPALISPFCENGVIMKYLKSHPEPEAKMLMMIGVAQGLQYLHREKIIHGDLKPNNILISNDGLPLLCDFGCSQILTHAGFTTRAVGTVRYEAPELFEEKDTKYNEAVDIYALAITCSEIWTGIQPYPKIKKDIAIILHVFEGGRPPCPSPTTTMTEPLWEIFEECWKKESEKRLSIDEVVQFLRDLIVPGQ